MAEIIGVGILVLISVSAGALLALGIIEAFCQRNKGEKLDKTPIIMPVGKNVQKREISQREQEELLEEWLYGTKA